MFCSKCGSNLIEGALYCPLCGNKIEREEKAQGFSDASAADSQKKESVDFDWEVEDFKHQKTRNIDMSWDDVDDSRRIMKSATVEEASVGFGDIVEEEEKEEVKEVNIKIVEEDLKGPDFSDERFQSFNRKNKEFQDLLDKERERIKKDKEEREKILLASEKLKYNNVLEIEEEPEEAAAASMAIDVEKGITLAADENNMEGQWPPEVEEEKDEIIEELSEETEEEITIEDVIKEVDSQKPHTKGYTQQISRDDFADYLKKMEAQYGIEENEETLEEEPLEEFIEEEHIEEMPEEEPLEEVKEEEEIPVQASQPQEALSIIEETDSDEDFWEEEEVKKSRIATFFIVFLSILLAAEVIILVIRFQFPDSQAAALIEPRVTLIENWLRSLF